MLFRTRGEKKIVIKSHLLDSKRALELLAAEKLFLNHLERLAAAGPHELLRASAVTAAIARDNQVSDAAGLEEGGVLHLRKPALDEAFHFHETCVQVCQQVHYLYLWYVSRYTISKTCAQVCQQVCSLYLCLCFSLSLRRRGRGWGQVGRGRAAEKRENTKKLGRRGRQTESGRGVGT
jgi:hypothetical protein